VVEALEEEAAQGNLKGAEIFLCTDNSTVEAALYQRSGWNVQRAVEGGSFSG
jgi:hypothetical protein